MIHPPSLRICYCLTLVLALAAGAAWSQSGTWQGPDGKPLPFTSHEEVLDFLRQAKVVSVEVLDEGVTTGKKKLTLELQGVRAHAVFRTFHREQRNVRTGSGQTIRNFVDSYEKELPAYELSRMLGYGRIPPVVERRIKGKKGSLQLWVEEVISEKGRRQQGLQAPDQDRWNLQVQNMILFDNLINNIDRNQGNILIDKSWEVWLIDHGRSFSQDWHLPQEAEMKRCGQRLWKAVEGLDESAVRSRLGPYLDGSQITALFKRHEQILDIFRQRIASEGEAEVLVAPE